MPSGLVRPEIGDRARVSGWFDRNESMTMIRLSTLFALLTGLAACDLPPPDPRLVANQCEARARAAEAPTGNFTFGTNSETGPFAEASIGITSDLLQGRDPVAVYEECVYQRTGQGPIRPYRPR